MEILPQMLFVLVGTGVPRQCWRYHLQCHSAPKKWLWVFLWV